MEIEGETKEVSSTNESVEMNESLEQKESSSTEQVGDSAADKVITALMKSKAFINEQVNTLFNENKTAMINEITAVVTDRVNTVLKDKNISIQSTIKKNEHDEWINKIVEKSMKYNKGQL